MRIAQLLAAAALAAMAVISIGAHAEPPTASIRAEMSGFRNNSGQAECALFSSQDGFPAKWEKAMRRGFVVIRGKTASCEFSNVPAGTYAVAVFHDENNNGRMDRNFVGAPSEGHGVSRDAKPGFMSPPSFQDAAFQYTGGVLVLPIPMHY
jgi:uncharacterized protein (DUF2141 family)